MKETKELNELIIPEGTEEIKSGEYQGLYPPIEKVIFPKSLKRIGSYAFSPNERVKEIYFRYYTDYITYLTGPRHKIKELIFPENLEEIGGCAFQGIQTLEKVVIPKNVKHIYQGAFQQTNVIEELYIHCSRLFGYYQGLTTKKIICSYDSFKELKTIINNNIDDYYNLKHICHAFSKEGRVVTICFEGPELTKEQKKEIKKLKKALKKHGAIWVSISFNVKELSSQETNTNKEVYETNNQNNIIETPIKKELDELSKLKEELIKISSNISTYIDKESIEKEIETIIKEYQEYKEDEANEKPKINWDNKIELDSPKKKVTKEDAIARLNSIKDKLQTANKNINDYKELYDALNDNSYTMQKYNDGTIKGLLNDIKQQLIIFKLKGINMEKFHDEDIIIRYKYKNKINQILNNPKSKKEYKEVENELRDELQELLNKINNVNYIDKSEKNNTPNILEQPEQSEAQITENEKLDEEKYNNDLKR